MSGNDLEDSETEGRPSIELPSGKSGSITRKQNQITKYIEEGNVELKKLEALQLQHATRVKKFEEACEAELAKNVPEADKEALLKYRKKNEKKYLIFKNKLELWLLEYKYSSDKEENDDNESDAESEESAFSKSTESSCVNKLPNKDTNEQLISTLLKNQETMKLPNVEPETFCGDVVKYNTFMLSFKRLIEEKCTSDEDKFYYLLRYTKGEPHELATSCHNTNAQKAYKDAKRLLHDQYGNENIAAQQYLDRLAKWEAIKSENSVELRKFALFLTTCLSMMEKMSSLNQLNSWRDIKEIMMKLPYDLRRSFRSLASKRMDSGDVVNFETLVKFVNEKARERNMPLIGDINDDKGRPKKDARKLDKHQTFYTDKDKEVSCYCCKKANHVLNDCIFFLKKTMNEREEFIKTKKLCFSCLEEGHRSKDCKNRIKCKTCGKFHPSSLHRNEKPVKKNESEKKDSDVETNMTIKNNTKVSCPAVPVIIENKNNGKKLRTYAALDNYSTSTYMCEELMRKLGLGGRNISLKLKTIEGKQSLINATVINNVKISCLDQSFQTSIPKVYAKKNWPFSYEDSPSKHDIQNLRFEKNVPFEYINEKIGILVGMDVPEILEPLEIVNSDHRGPYASRHRLGWALNGPVKGSATKMQCFRTAVTEDSNEIMRQQFNEVFDSDFEDTGKISKYSYDEQQWLNSVKENTQKVNGNFEISIPLNNNHHDLSNNYYQVKCRFDNLLKKLKCDKDLCKEYCEFMNLMSKNDFMEKVSDCEDPENGKYWYLAHHPVRHKQKNKVRIVFDCSLRYRGMSINDVLLKGPDLANTLVGVLLRFRINRIAVSGDISKMFYRVHLPEKQRDFFRFLWCPDGDLTREPEVFRMRVHIFGATSSPAIANFALKMCSDEVANTEVKKIIHDGFYVDDLMSSFDNEEDAITTILEVTDTLSSCGFELTSFASNSKNILSNFPKEKLSKSAEQVEIDGQEMPQERALGVKWKTQEDTLGYIVKLSEQPLTKRGILSTIHSVFDPLFLVSPALIPAKRLFQKCCQSKIGWDDPLPAEIESKWIKWKEQIKQLGKYEVPRCYKNTTNPIVETQLHIFCDGSLTAYGAVGYIRQKDSQGDVSCNIVMAKARLTPLSNTSLKTTPRIELNAAKTGVTLYQKLVEELNDIEFDGGVYFWTDSSIVLSYISSDKGVFHTFVANRVAFIRSSTNVEQWKKVPGKQNPADILSRGVGNIHDFLNNNMWKEGPPFLKSNEYDWPQEVRVKEITPNDPELKKETSTFVTRCNENHEDPFKKILNSTSNFIKLLMRLATMLRLKNMLLRKDFQKGIISAEEIKVAEKETWKQVQISHFGKSLQYLKANKPLPKCNSLRKLNLFIDNDGLIRVGGRLRNSNLTYDAKYPVLLHANSRAVELLIEETHRNLGHLGREAVATALKQKYYLHTGNKVIRNIIKRCIICKKVQGTPAIQLMHDLPPDRVQGDVPPFTNVGTDLFGPYFVSKGRGTKQEKRYGIIFTCLSSRAAHLEITSSLDADSYINALRRFTCRRGTPMVIRSDNGTNLTSADKELKAAIKEINIQKLEEYCSQIKIDWKFQPPQASHFGGVFEREIRTVRKILNSLLLEFQHQIKLTDDLLSTLFCEVENILNSRPLTIVTTDNDDSVPLTANDILRLNSSDTFPTGIFKSSDVYCKRRWRQAQHLADIFWTRFKHEYLPLLQTRSKWHVKKPSLKPGDIVLVVDKLLPRNEWCVGKVIKVKISDDGCVRSGEVSVLRNKYMKNKFDKIIIHRPISKLIVLCSASDM